MNLIIRNFWHILRKFKTTSIMVVLGLTVAFTVFLTVAMQCWYDFGYNRNFNDAGKIYLPGLKHELFGWMFSTTLFELENIAFVVATPVVAYYITNRWLETFAYKIPIHWWIFVLCWLFMCIIILLTICMQTYRTAMKNPVDAIKNE